MKIIMGNVYQPFSDGSTVSITRSVSDPVPTCSLSLQDNNSSIFPQAMQELLVLDDQMVPNPTVNMFLNPGLNPYTTNWTVLGLGNPNPFTGMTLSQVVGGGVTATMSNLIQGDAFFLQSQMTATGSAVPGQTYVLSFYAQGGSTPTNITAIADLQWTFANGFGISTAHFIGTVPISTTLTRYSVTVTAPAGASAAQIQLGVRTSSGTNSGSITFTQVQLEPQWFPTLSYPLPWCGPSQTNCRQLPNGLWIRQYRKFAGFVTHVTYDNYKGNVRTVAVDAVGYAWLMSLVICNNTYASQADSAIISNLLSTYFPGMFTTANVVTGTTLSNFGSNWDDVRTLFDNLASQIGYYWTVDYYWNAIYAPPGYFSMPIALICDNSSTPDMVTTFPAYNFSAETDYTQPGSVALVIGSGTNVAEVIDPNTSAMNGFIAGYSFKSGSTFMRKINDSTLQSVNDCTQRGMAELLQYDYPRFLYHLTTNVELLPGQSIQITSNTDNLSQSTQLIQQVTATWLGVSATLTDTWEYKADLGAVNRAATNIISRLARKLNSNTSAPAISATTLAVIESLGMTDSAATSSTLATGYAPTILADGPVAYYRLNNLEGAVADDFSGNAYAGTIVNSPTLGVATLLTDPADSTNTAITFASASSQDITLPTAMIPTGAHAWSLECWFKITAIPSSGIPTLMGWGAATGNQKFGVLNLKTNGGTSTQLILSTNNGDITSGNLAINTIYYAVGTYDGTNTRLYLNGTLVAGPTPFTLSLTATMAQIGSYTGYSSSFFSGTIDEAAFYTSALSPTQITNHYNAGRP